MAVEFAAAALDRAAVSPGRKPGYVDAPRVTVVAGADGTLRRENLLPRSIVMQQLHMPHLLPYLWRKGEKRNKFRS